MAGAGAKGPGGGVALPGMGGGKKEEPKKDLFAQFEASRQGDAASIVAEMAVRMKGLRQAAKGEGYDSDDASEDDYSDDDEKA